MKTVSNIFSYIFQPVLIPFLSAILLVNVIPYSLIYTITQKLFLTIGILLFTGIIPAAVVIFQLKKGEVSDVFISQRKERTIAYLATLASYTICCFFLRFVGMDLWIVLLMAASTLALIIVSIINLWWKISAHATGMGGFCGCVFTGAFILQTNPVGLFSSMILISGCVMASRVYLKAHTLGQVFAGFLVGLVTTGSVLLIAL